MSETIYKVVSGVPTITDAATFLAGLPLSIIAKTANYTLTTADYGIEFTANNCDATFPEAVAGKAFSVSNSGSGTITIKTTSSQTVGGYASGAITLPQGATLTVIGNAAGTAYLIT